MADKPKQNQADRDVQVQRAVALAQKWCDATLKGVADMVSPPSPQNDPAGYVRFHARLYAGLQYALHAALSIPSVRDRVCSLAFSEVVAAEFLPRPPAAMERVADSGARRL